MKIELTGVKEFKRKLDSYKRSITRELERDTDRALINIQTGAKRRVVVDTARLRSAIHYRRDGTSGEVSVYYSVHYAPYIEFGTGNLVSVPDELKEIAEEFRGKGQRQVNLPARPFLYPAFLEERSKYINRMRKTLGRLRTV